MHKDAKREVKKAKRTARKERLPPRPAELTRHTAARALELLLARPGDRGFTFPARVFALFPKPSEKYRYVIEFVDKEAKTISIRKASDFDMRVHRLNAQHPIKSKEELDA